MLKTGRSCRPIRFLTDGPMKKKPAPKAKPVHTPRSFDWRRLIPFAALWVLTLAAYSNSFQGGLVYDNAAIIGKDIRLRAVSSENVRLILTGEYWYPATGNGLYRPFTTLTYLFNYAALGNGPNPAGYRVVNYAIHSLNASFVFLLALILFGETTPAFAMAAIWAVHPALTESVTNIVGRADLLAAFGVLAAVLCFARGRDSGGTRRAAWWVASGIAAAIGIFSKESAIVVVGAVPLFDLAFRRKETWRARLTGYAAVALPCCLFLLVRQAVLRSSPVMRLFFTDNPIASTDFWTGRLTAIGVLGRQIALLAWPLRLSADYSYNAVPLANGITGTVAAGIAILIAAAALAVWGYRRDRKIFFLIAFGLGALLPTSNLLFPIGTIMAERFLYLPAIAFAGCVAAAFWALRGRIEVLWIRVAVAAVALCFAARTFARNFDWDSEKALFQSAAVAEPASFRPHTDLASIYLRGGQLEDAVREADRSLQILDPLSDLQNLPNPYVTAGKVYSDKADSLPAAEGEAWRKKALETLRRGERITTALNERYKQDDLAHGRPFHPMDLSVLYEHLGYVALKSKNFDESAVALEKAIRLALAPDMFINLATALAGKNDPHGAEVAMLEGMIWRHDDGAIATNLIKLFSLAEPNGCALIRTGNSFRLNTNCPLVQSELCEASARLIPLLQSQGQKSDAERVRTGALHAGCTP
jgi:protein O-mannosyl-transferase